jgi:acetoacetyl-CoA synthetase
MKQLLWSPSSDNANNMDRFAHYASGLTQQKLSNYEQLHRWSIDQPEVFWKSIWGYFDVYGDTGSEIVRDIEKMPGAQWFPDTKLNFAENLLKHAKSLANDVAIIEYTERGKQLEITFGDLLLRVSRLALTLTKLGVKKGDRVAAISTNTHHAIVGMLATTSLGAVWSSCSPDFGVNGILDRFSQIEPKILLCCTRYQYAAKEIDLRDKINEVGKALGSLSACIHFDPFSNSSSFTLGLSIPDYSYESIVESTGSTGGEDEDQNLALDFQPCDFNDPLYILFSSGTTGRPKCIVHGVGGTLLQHLKELGLHTDLNEGDRLFYFTTCGWMMWNWYVSALALGCTLVCYDGSPFHPFNQILFDIADAESLKVFGASAKYFAACEKYELKPRESHQLSALKAILSTGSPLAPESFDYIYRDIKNDVRVSSISGGTDIVSCFALGNPSLPVFSGELQCAGLGMDLHFYDDQGKSLKAGKGELVCATSFPSMPIGFWNDENNEKYNAAYFARFDGVWAHGDFGEFCEHTLSDGSRQNGVMIHGRSDAVLNPCGVRIGTAEIYRQVEQVPEVFESIAVGQKWSDDERVILFVRLQPGQQLSPILIDQIKHQIRENTSPRHVPAKIIAVDDIPRTRSGKIVELAVRNIIHGETVNNTEALANPEALELFRNLPELKF